MCVGGRDYTGLGLGIKRVGSRDGLWIRERFRVQGCKGPRHEGHCPGEQEVRRADRGGRRETMWTVSGCAFACDSVRSCAFLCVS